MPSKQHMYEKKKIVLDSISSSVKYEVLVFYTKVVFYLPDLKFILKASSDPTLGIYSLHVTELNPN